LLNSEADLIGEKYFSTKNIKPVLSHCNLKKKTFPSTYNIHMFDGSIRTLKEYLRSSLILFKRTETFMKKDNTKFHRDNFEGAIINETLQSRFIIYLNQEERAMLFGFYMSVRKFKNVVNLEGLKEKKLSEAIEDIDRRYLEF